MYVVLYFYNSAKTVHVFFKSVDDDVDLKLFYFKEELKSLISNAYVHSLFKMEHLNMEHDMMTSS